MTTTTPIPVWRPTIKGVAVEGFWRVYAFNEQSARLMLIAMFQRRAYFVELRQWQSAGEEVEVVTG